MVAPREEHFWTKLRSALGDPPELARPEFDEARSRQAHRDELLPLLEDDLRGQRLGATGSRRSRHAGVPAAPVNRMPAVFDDPNVAARGMIRSFPMDDSEMRAVGNAIKVVGRAREPASAPAGLGGDTDAVLRSLLGLRRRSRSSGFGRRACSARRS